MNSKPQYETLDEARIEAKLEARKSNADRFIATDIDGKFIVLERQPFLGQYWHVYSDGLVLQRG